MTLATCGYMLSGLLRELRARGIPFHNPHRKTNGAWNPMRSARRLAAYLRHDPQVWGDQARAWTWQDLHDWIDPLDARTALPRGTKAYVDTMITPDRFGESRAHDEVPLDTLCTLLGDPGTLTHPAFHADTAWWAGALRTSRRRTLEYPLRVLARRGGQALTETPRLTVGTGHSVKGGEADHVIIAPDLSRQGAETWERRGDDRAQLVRLFYVMLTRARHSVTVLDPAGPGHVPLELLEPAPLMQKAAA